jgi:predicted Zn-dependent peptidase
LSNGLTIVLNEDPTTPTVAVSVTYRVGSSSEVVGRTGFAHLFEHLMFQGSKHVPKGEHFRPGRQPERYDEPRPHQLLPGVAFQRSRARAVVLFLTETVRAIASLTARQAVLGRPDNYYDAYREALENANPAEVFAVARESFSFDPPVIVVAGDAARLKPALSRFGSVNILDPRRNFAALDDASYRQRSPP